MRLDDRCRKRWMENRKARTKRSIENGREDVGECGCRDDGAVNGGSAETVRVNDLAALNGGDCGNDVAGGEDDDESCVEGVKGNSLRRRLPIVKASLAASTVPPSLLAPPVPPPPPPIPRDSIEASSPSEAVPMLEVVVVRRRSLKASKMLKTKKMSLMNLNRIRWELDQMIFPVAVVAVLSSFEADIYTRDVLFCVSI